MNTAKAFFPLWLVLSCYPQSTRMFSTLLMCISLVAKATSLADVTLALQMEKAMFTFEIKSKWILRVIFFFQYLTKWYFIMLIFGNFQANKFKIFLKGEPVTDSTSNRVWLAFLLSQPVVIKLYLISQCFALTESILLMMVIVIFTIYHTLPI